MFKQFLKNRILISTVFPLLITALISIAFISGLLNSIHHKFADTLFTNNSPSKQVVIIGVDSKSVAEETGLGPFNQWSRQRFVDLINVILKESPAVVTFDFLFSTSTTNIYQEEILGAIEEIEDAGNNAEKLEILEKFIYQYEISTDNPADQRLSDAFKQLDSLVLGATFEQGQITKPIYYFLDNAALGVMSATLDSDGIWRQAQPFFIADGQTYDNMAVATVKEFTGREDLGLPLENGKLNINYFGDPYSYNSISFVDVIKGHYPENFFKDKIVLVGPIDSKTFHDEYLTPRSNTTPMPGIEVRANEIQTILDQKFLHNQTTAATILTIALLSALLSLALSYLGIVSSILLTIATIGGYTAAAHFAYSRGLILNMIYPYVAIILTYLGSWVFKYFIADRHKRELKSAFGHYVSKELVEQISKNPDLVKLGGENKEITVFFSDIEGSTSLSEQIAIEQWVAQINEYFTVMEDVVMRSGGTLDKYEGDAIMGFWNAPISQSDHVKRAHAAALQMQISLKQLHRKWQQEGKPLINIRIGVNTGPALVGNFGSKNRLDYTVMGDTVNTASRLESAANKSYNTRICVSEPLQPEFSYRELDLVLLPGKKEAVKIYELFGLANLNPQQQAILANYAAGLSAYRQKNWAQALAEFEKNPQDGPSQIMKERCQLLISNAPISGLNLQTMVFSIAHK